MAAVSRKYLPGYTGTITIDGTAYPVSNISYDHDPGMFETTSDQSGGCFEQEASIQKWTFTFDTMVKNNAGAPVFPGFFAGLTYPLIFGANGSNAWTGNVSISKSNMKVDLKGGMIVSTTADSQGLPTSGSLVPAGLIVTPPGN